MENSESWRLMAARMTSLGNLLDGLTHKALDLLTAAPNAAQILQAEMTAMRIEARRLVKTIRKNVAELKAGA